MRDIQVLFAERYSSNDKVSKIVRGFRSDQRAISGQSNLTQRVAKIMTTDMGSNYFTQEVGTDIRELNKVAIGSTDDALVRAIALQVILQTEKQIKADQDNYRNLTSEELLDKIELVGLDFLPDSNTWKLRLSIYNQSNQVSVLEI
jgi:phage baseplate assembly protein W